MQVFFLQFFFTIDPHFWVDIPIQCPTHTHSDGRRNTVLYTVQILSWHFLIANWFDILTLTFHWNRNILREHYLIAGMSPEIYHLRYHLRRVAFASAMHIFTPLTAFGPIFPPKIMHIHQCPCALWNSNKDPVATKTVCDCVSYKTKDGVNYVTTAVELEVGGIAVFV